MLSARLDGETILLHEPRWDDQEDFLRTAARAKRVLAPCCGAPLVLRWGLRKVRHFAHPPKAGCLYERWAESESPEHMAGKIRLYDWCRQAFGDRIRTLALEYPIRETLQRPDVYLELDDGTRYALEYQRSAISPGEWTERHAAYRGLGINDIWVLGDNRLADALPTGEQRARWAAREPHMQFLNLRAFETAAGVPTPFELAWWRGDGQEELWEPLELDARVGREVAPWYRRSALARLRSLTFLDVNTGELQIFRAMRELPRHTDTLMVSATLRLPLASPDLELTPAGFVTPADRERLERHEARVVRLEAAVRQAPARMDNPAAPPAPVADKPLPAQMSAYFHALRGRRASVRWPADVDARLFLPGWQEEEQQQRRLPARSEVPEWRKIVDRYGLTPENLHYLVGIPIPDDTVFLVHRTVWQAYIYYGVAKDQQGSFTARGLADRIARKVGVHAEMVRVARYLLPGQVNAPEDVVGQFLNLLVDAGYLRNDMRSEHFRYHALENPPPPFAFVDRTQRWQAWAGLLSQTLGRQGGTLLGEGDAPLGDGGPIRLAIASMADRPTPAQVAAVARLARQADLAVDLEALTYTEAGRILSTRRAKQRG
ncbi:MAG TPA: competence protein CoiA family protein [Symbiobacteriaceae bacterium]|jgi:hypothetical protein